MPPPKAKLVIYELDKGKHPAQLVLEEDGTATLRVWDDMVANYNDGDGYDDTKLGREHTAIFQQAANHLYKGNKCIHAFSKTFIEASTCRQYCDECEEYLENPCEQCGREALWILEEKKGNVGTYRCPDYCAKCIASRKEAAERQRQYQAELAEKAKQREAEKARNKAEKEAEKAQVVS
jgi:hypothetical protein